MVAATASAQWAVTDAGNLSQNLKNFKELQKQVGYLKEQKNKLESMMPSYREKAAQAKELLKKLADQD